jgi:uncharacterized protein YndB with AHSA1/START domain
MTTMTDQQLATQVYQVFIKSTPEAIWDAITKPEFTVRYYYGSRIEVTPDRMSWVGRDGTVLGDLPTFEFDPPRRLVHEWRSVYDPEMFGEPPSRVTWEIEPQENGLTKLMVVHDRLDESPKTAENVYGPGWMMVLSGLKTLLETGQSLTG